MSGLSAPLARVRGLGSAKEGVEHWWMQRLTALALVPLTLWFVYSAVRLTGASHAVAASWLKLPQNATLMILLIAAGFHHGQLGLQVVIEDYVHTGGRKLACLIAVKFLAVLLAVGAIVGVLKTALGG
jgi:succinate dehydrogenase / fumarate reductase, membrane anchor subunit